LTSIVFTIKVIFFFTTPLQQTLVVDNLRRVQPFLFMVWRVGSFLSELELQHPHLLERQTGNTCQPFFLPIVCKKKLLV